jgi:hypothetical protein
MSRTTIPAEVIENAVYLACRAPSYHNSQPWRWSSRPDICISSSMPTGWSRPIEEAARP